MLGFLLLSLLPDSHDSHAVALSWATWLVAWQVLLLPASLSVWQCYRLVVDDLGLTLRVYASENTCLLVCYLFILFLFIYLSNSFNLFTSIYLSISVWSLSIYQMISLVSFYLKNMTDKKILIVRSIIIVSSMIRCGHLVAAQLSAWPVHSTYLGSKLEVFSVLCK